MIRDGCSYAKIIAGDWMRDLRGSENRHEFFLVAAYWVAYASAVWFVCGVFVMCALVWEFC